MADKNQTTTSRIVMLTAAAAVGFAGCLLYRRYRRRLYGGFSNRQIEIVENVDQCQKVVADLKKHCETYRVLGFDCEWITVGGTRRPCALLQLSSYKGLCALFRLCSLQQIPRSLRELLEDENLIKVGVGAQDDAQKLSFDYGVGVASTLDLRFMAAMAGRPTEGLAKLSKNVLGITLNKHWRIACSDWEAPQLTTVQQIYAANDALVAVEVFKKLAKEIEPRFWPSFYINAKSHATVFERLEPFFDIRFKENYYAHLSKTSNATNRSASQGTIKSSSKQNTFKQSRGMATVAKCVYDNCYLQAPDGELLCTIDRKKATWYLDENLATEVKGCEVFTVRLNFEPAGRAVGDVGKFYQIPKENRCVVCGRSDAYIRKNVVPREYRKHFPLVMKSHTSHDVLLLCPNCHQTSNMSDLMVRRKLADMCDAPIVNDDHCTCRLVEIPGLRDVRSAGRALLNSKAHIPETRLNQLKDVILKHFEASELTEDLIKKAANIVPTMENSDYQNHGEKVVQRFKEDLGGLVVLEKIWREHFLNSMKPKHLPHLWSVDHNKNRLEVRAKEGRINTEDLLLAGIDVDK